MKRILGVARSTQSGGLLVNPLLILKRLNDMKQDPLLSTNSEAESERTAFCQSVEPLASVCPDV